MIPLTLWTMSSTAFACGGMFCDTSTTSRVDQSGERIVFSVDPVEDCVEMHVEITYEGSAEDFAWIVPVPSEPEISLSTTMLFDVLGNSTAPSFRLNIGSDGSCAPLVRGCGDSGKSGDVDLQSNDAFVEVSTEELVGPYETVTLRGSSGAAIIDWLQTNQYELPSNLDAALDPYVDEGSWFVAMRLSQDDSGGILDPVSLKFPGTQTPTIPLRLTSVAATENMPITVWVLGSQSYAPANAARVTLNPVRVGWFDQFESYTDLLSEAVDEAGGEAWLIESVTTTVGRADLVYAGAPVDGLVERLSETSDPAEFAERVRTDWSQSTDIGADTDGFFVPSDEALDAMLATCIDLSSTQIDAGQFWQDPAAYTDLWSVIDFDPSVCAERLGERLFYPREHAAGLLRGAGLATRMTTTISPSEMQTDPQFGPTAVPLQVERLRQATQLTHCVRDASPARRRRTLMVDDFEVPMPSQSWIEAQGLTDADWVALAETPAAAVIERMNEEGELEVLVDNRDAIAEAFGGLRREGPAGDPCGCSGNRRSASGLFLLLMVAIRRRP